MGGLACKDRLVENFNRLFHGMKKWLTVWWDSGGIGARKGGGGLIGSRLTSRGGSELEETPSTH